MLAKSTKNVKVSHSQSYQVLKLFLVLFLCVWVIVIMWRFIIYMDRVDKNINDGDKVCMSIGDFEALKSSHEPTVLATAVAQPSFTRERDLRVLQDPLYPAYDRTDKDTFDSVVDNTLRRNINVPTQRYNDTYHLVGYISNPDDPVGNYKLFGRQKDRNRGNYYLIPVNKNYDMKIQVTDGNTVGEKLRDIDTLPDEMSFNTPLLATTPYTFTQLPKGDLTDTII